MIPFSLTEINKGQVPVFLNSEGIFELWGHTRYLLKLENPDGDAIRAIDALPRSIYEPLQSDLGVLNLKNNLGYLMIAGIPCLVKSQKLTGEENPTEKMLQDITQAIASLPFTFNAPTFLPFEISESENSPVLYHQWLLLSAWIDGNCEQEALEGALGKVLHDPHRRWCHEQVRVSIDRCPQVAPRTMVGIVTNPAALCPISAESRLAHTGLGQSLKGNYFPEWVEADRREVDLDTPENRFVKYVLTCARDLNQRFKRHIVASVTCMNPDLLSKAQEIEGMLAHCLSHPFFAEIGDLRYFPTQSTVLMRKEGYRDFLVGYSHLDASIQFPIHPQDLENILETKNIAKLYEYWCYFQLAEALVELCGAPEKALISEATETQVNLARETRLIWRLKGYTLSLSYDRTFRGRKPQESYSVELRPDITLEYKGKRYLFDAKFKLDGITWEDDTPQISGASSKQEDLYKMHTYLEAIAGGVSAIALYPGEAGASRLFGKPGKPEVPFHGIGAIPLRPGERGENGLSNFLTLIVNSSDVALPKG